MEEATPNPPNKRIAVVTGGNKGIGLEVCRQLAGAGITVVLTARDETRGTAAVEKLRGAGLSNIIFHQLEITDAWSIARLADFLKTRFGKLDILVNNAAIGAVEYIEDPFDSSLVSQEKSLERYLRAEIGPCYLNIFSLSKVFGNDCFINIKHPSAAWIGIRGIDWLFNAIRETYDAATDGVQTNYYGTKNVIEALLPLLQASSNGRIVNVSSDGGLLKHIRNEELKQELNDIDNLTEERLDEVLDEFLKDFKAGELEARGWPTLISAYRMAKVALNAYSRMLARRHPELRVNCVHPGYVNTDMTMHSGNLTPEEGASNVTRVALLPGGGPTGAYFALDQEAPFV